MQRYLESFSPWGNLRAMSTNIGPDVLAGVTVAVIALPLALAFGVASGLGASAGMWAAICGGLFVGVFGGSKVGVSGPTGPKVVQLAAIVEATRLATGEADAQYLFTLVFLSGLVCIGLALLKIGRFIYYVPYSAVSGFMCGIGAIIILLEIPAMLGFETPSSVVDAIKQLPYDVLHEDPRTVLVSGATFAAILIWPRVTPIKAIPGPLVGLFVGTLIANAFRFDIEYIGDMPTGLPPIYLPSMTLLGERFGEMIGPAFALAGLCVFDSLLTCLVADNMTDERHNSDREIFGQGIANMACGLVGGVTTATATMRTVANVKCGAKTGLASIVHGAVLLALMLGLAPLASYVPMACLAGILLKVGIDIIDYRVLPVLHRMPLSDGLCFWVVLILTISFDLLVAMSVGVAIAFVRTIHEFGRLYDQEVVDLKHLDRTWPGEESMSDELKTRVLKLRLEGPLFFGVADTIYRTLADMVDHDYLIVRMARVPSVDMSGAYLLDDVLDKAERYKARVLITGMNDSVRDTLERFRIIDKVGETSCVATFEDAVARIEQIEELRTGSSGERPLGVNDPS